MATSFEKRYGPWALVTGAAEGLGAAYAAELARRGLNLVLVDVQQTKLEATAASLRELGREVDTHPLDMAAADSASPLAALFQQRDIGLLVHCAAVSPIGEFTALPVEAHLHTLNTNARGTLLLVHATAAALSRRGAGAMLLVSSGSALTGAPLVAHYAATKAYIEILGMSLASELAPYGVEVLVSCPGLIRTAATKANPPDLTAASWVRMLDAEEVVKNSLAALGKTWFCVPAGWGERLGLQLLSRWLPRRLALKLLDQTMRRLYPNAPVGPIEPLKPVR